jgi:predicted extracellular nuclease
MSNKLKIATFNAQNLFGRAKVFGFSDHNAGDEILTKVGELQKLIEKEHYTDDDKKLIEELYKSLKEFIEVRENRGKLFKKRGWVVKGVAANGKGEWDGEIEFKKEKFKKPARGNTSKVLQKVNADIACMVEVESRPLLRSFDSHLLHNKYKYEMLIDANDPRGIDVGLFSKFPIGGVWTHMFEKKGNKKIFSRDCLEVEVFLPENQRLFILCNHFKSRGYDYDGEANEKRKRQAYRVAEILQKYDLQNDFVVVAGDLNDSPASDPLSPLKAITDLHDVLEIQYPDDPDKRWTYHYEKFEQIDFLLVSTPLREKFKEAGVERRGIYKLEELTGNSTQNVEVEKEFNTVTHPKNAASDHGAVWAKFEL